LTGFDAVVLQGTGMGPVYLATVASETPPDTVSLFFQAVTQILQKGAGDEAALNTLIAADLFPLSCYGGLACRGGRGSDKGHSVDPDRPLMFPIVREIDLEIARWGSVTDPTTAQFVVQPHRATWHLQRFTASCAVRTRHTFTWSAGRVTFVSTRIDTGAIIASYTYTGADVPKPGDERVHLSFWLHAGAAPINGLPAEVIVESFTFVP